MKFFETSKYYTFKKSTYINLRWIGIVGQFIAVNFVYFFLNFKFNFITSNIIIFLGALSNLYLIFIYKKTQLSDRSAFYFLIGDLFQLGILLYLTGGVNNPFSIFLLSPSIFSAPNLSLKTNSLLVFLTTIVIIILTFYSEVLPGPISDHFHISPYYHYSIPVSLIIASIFFKLFCNDIWNTISYEKRSIGKNERSNGKRK